MADPSDVLTASDQTSGPEQGDMDLRLDHQLCFALYSATNAVGRVYRAVLEPIGLTFPQFLAMLVLWEHSPRSVSEIARALELDFNTVTPLTKRLEASGLVTRARDKADERRVYIEVTEKGTALRADVLVARQSLLCRFPLTEQERSTLRVSLKHLSDMLRRDGEP